MVHISPWDATLGLIIGAAMVLPPGSPLYLHGPYKREGFATAPSNQAFDRNLRDRNPIWGLRELESVAAIAQSVGFSVPTVTEMPANNLSVVFRRWGRLGRPEVQDDAALGGTERLRQPSVKRTGPTPRSIIHRSVMRSELWTRDLSPVSILPKPEPHIQRPSLPGRSPRRAAKYQ